MSENTFILTYRSGKQERTTTDADSCEAQSMRSFGMTLAEVRDFGGNVELESEVAAKDLKGSSVQPALVKVAGVEVQLGEVVRVAFEKSGLTADEWNALDDDIREAYIAAEIDELEEGGEAALTQDGIAPAPTDSDAAGEEQQDQ